MLPDEKHLEHWIDHFYGYGSWQARIWFIAYEDGGGDLPEEVAEKLKYFYQTHPSASQPQLCDIRESYRNILFRSDGPKATRFKTGYDYRFGSNAIQNGIWKNLASFVFGYRGETLPDLFEYQKNLFAHPSSHEALITLYPLPSPHNHAWYYSWLDMPRFGFLKRRALYLEHLYPTRINAILRSIAAYQPEVVVMYGMSDINELKNSVATHFPSGKFKSVKAMPQLIPQHHTADLNGTKLIITTQIPALRHGRIGTGFDWEKFGDCIKSQPRSGSTRNR